MDFESCKSSIDNFDPLKAERAVPILRKESEEWVNALTAEEFKYIRKYTYNSMDEKSSSLYRRINSMLRGESAFDEKLQKYANVISNAIDSFVLQHDIIAYRGTDADSIFTKKAGELYYTNQFISTSLSRRRCFSKKFFVVFCIRKNANVAYIELVSKFRRQRELLLNINCLCKVVVITNNSAIVEVIS